MNKIYLQIPKDIPQISLHNCPFRLNNLTDTHSYIILLSYNILLLETLIDIPYLVLKEYVISKEFNGYTIFEI